MSRSAGGPSASRGPDALPTSAGISVTTIFLKDIDQALEVLKNSEDDTMHDYFVVPQEVLSHIKHLCDSNVQVYVSPAGVQKPVPENIKEIYKFLIDNNVQSESLKQLDQTEVGKASPATFTDNTRDTNKRAIVKKPDFRYSARDSGPYVVFMQATDPNNGLNKLRDMRLGKLLLHNKVANITNVEKRGSRIAVYFNNYKDANNAVENDNLKQSGLTAFVPSHTVTCKGLVKNVDEDLTEEEILANISSEKEVLEIRRLNIPTRSGDTTRYVPSTSIVITFAGKFIPNEITIYFSRRYVDYYMFPVRQCYHCLEYGHTAAICKRKEPRCPNCALDHEMEDCKSNNTSCYQCEGEHLCTEKGTRIRDRVCPEYIRQKKIKESMAFQALSFFEASKLHPREYNKIGYKQPAFQRRREQFPKTLGNQRLNNPNQTTSGPPKMHYKYSEKVKAKPKRHREESSISSDTSIARVKRRIRKSSPNKTNGVALRPAPALVLSDSQPTTRFEDEIVLNTEVSNVDKLKLLVILQNQDQALFKKFATGKFKTRHISKWTEEMNEEG